MRSILIAYFSLLSYCVQGCSQLCTTEVMLCIFLGIWANNMAHVDVRSCGQYWTGSEIGGQVVAGGQITEVESCKQHSNLMIILCH